MLPILEFVFSSFWVWLGFTVTLGTVVAGLHYLAVVLVAIVRR